MNTRSDFMLDIKVTRIHEEREKPNSEDLGFGNYFTDHMFTMSYTEGKGWHDPEIKPYAEISLDPSSAVFHYGQEMFEGMKAYSTKDGTINLFRPDMNAKRVNKTNDRICMPSIDEEDFVQSVKALVEIDKSWIPEGKDTSLYIRPFIIATEPTLMVHPSKTYLFMIILSPVGAYYKEGLNPVKIFVEDEYSRAVLGGVGEAKTGGNYSSSLIAQKKAKQNGFAQVLWLDAIEHKYVEEVGTMNIFFKIGGKVVTPMLSGSILAGITRDSVIKLLKSWDVPIEETQVTIDEIIRAADSGELEEAFGTGTAAVISAVGGIHYMGKDIVINNNAIGDLSQKVYSTLTDIQCGRIEDPMGWIVKV